MNVQSQRKKQTRSLLPRIEPVRPAAESPRVRARSRPTAADSLPAVPPPWNPDAEATWQSTVAALSAAIEEWSADTATEGNDEELGADTENTEEARERQRAWDRLMVQVMDSMPEPRRRQWLAEQRIEEEWRSRSTPKARDLDAFSDWSGSGSREYVD
ncbi:hypothetical protein B0H12DRAFT_1245073 [Mycena haematopus]|nr:hypothetical protein B0H12DRAFT_1245073 [Mycena haematopus]